MLGERMKLQRDDEGVGCRAGTEEDGKNHIAPETKDAAEAGQAADLAEGPRQRRAAHAAASSTCSNTARSRSRIVSRRA